MLPQDYNSTLESSSDEASLNVNKWKIRTLDRRGNKMRLLVNLDKDQSIGFKSFKKLFKSEEITDEQFVKIVFLHGIESMNEKASRLIKEYAKNNKEDLAASGIVVTEGEDGSIHLSESEKTPDEE